MFVADKLEGTAMPIDMVVDTKALLDVIDDVLYKAVGDTSNWIENDSHG